MSRHFIYGSQKPRREAIGKLNNLSCTCLNLQQRLCRFDFSNAKLHVTFAQMSPSVQLDMERRLNEKDAALYYHYQSVECREETIGATKTNFDTNFMAVNKTPLRIYTVFVKRAAYLGSVRTFFLQFDTKNYCKCYLIFAGKYQPI